LTTSGSFDAPFIQVSSNAAKRGPTRLEALNQWQDVCGEGVCFAGVGRNRSADGLVHVFSYSGVRHAKTRTIGLCCLCTIGYGADLLFCHCGHNVKHELIGSRHIYRRDFDTYLKQIGNECHIRASRSSFAISNVAPPQQRFKTRTVVESL
jgi:hypothetical protein